MGVNWVYAQSCGFLPPKHYKMTLFLHKKEVHNEKNA